MATRWTSAIGAGMRLYLARRIAWHNNQRRLGSAARAIQADQLRRLLRRAESTEIGRRHGFGRLAGLGDDELPGAFRRETPRSEYEDLRDDLSRMREAGDPDVLWPGRVMDWAETSGTTGGQKYIPVSAEMMASNHRAALDIFAHASRMGCSLPTLFGGRTVFLGGCTDLSVNEHGIRTGDLSALVTPLIHWPISAVYSPGKDIALMSHWPDKIEAMARLCLDQDIRGVSGMASWSLVLFRRVLELARERGQEIDRLEQIWPNLRLFIHGGVKYDPFDARVRCAWSGDADRDVPLRVEVYPASEGFIAVQDRKGDPGLRLNTDIGIFYEFIPLEEVNDPDARAFCCDEVEAGQRYVVCLTTCAGMWRYVIGDVVEFDTIPPAGPPRLRIVGRHRHFINAFGENLIVEEIERAVTHAAEAAGIPVGEFTAGPVYPAEGRRGGLELVIECRDAGPAPEAFTAAFDERLREINVDYNTKRSDDLGMAPPTVSVVGEGAFHRWMERRGRLGGQNKCPRCANHRDYVEGVLGQVSA